MYKIDMWIETIDKQTGDWVLAWAKYAWPNGSIGVEFAPGDATSFVNRWRPVTV